MTWPRVPFSEVLWITSEEMRTADAAALGTFGIEPLQLMEIAGYQVARLAVALLEGAKDKRVTIIAGRGNNGGDALVAGRHLAQRGAVVQAWVLGPEDRLGDLTRRHLRTTTQMGITVHDASAEPFVVDAELIVDGLLGTGVRLPLRGPTVPLIRSINQSKRQILAVDVPSGLDADTGEGDDQCVRAAATLTLGLPKRGLMRARSVGRLFLADIGIPTVVFGAEESAVMRVYMKGDLVELIENGR